MQHTFLAQIIEVHHRHVKVPNEFVAQNLKGFSYTTIQLVKKKEALLSIIIVTGIWRFSEVSQVKTQTPAFGQYFAPNPKSSITVRTFFTVLTAEDCSITILKIYHLQIRINKTDINLKWSTQ